jgi:anti-sigma factor RsiW
MSEASFSDETLMAYADGELDGAAAARVAAAAEHDPNLEARIDTFRRSRELVREAIAPAAEAPVPPRLLAAVERAARSSNTAGTVTPLRSTAGGRTERAATTSRRARWAWPLAASLALLVGAGGGFILGRGAGPDGVERAVAFAGVGWRTVLDRAAAGTRADVDGATLAVIGSFRRADGGLCREFRVERAAEGAFVAIACHGGSGWQPDLIVRTAGGDAYAPASAQATLDARVTALGGGPFLDPAAERDALDRLN